LWCEERGDARGAGRAAGDGGGDGEVEGGESVNAIRKLRKTMRRNRQQLGMFFGVSRETVRAWENGRADPPEIIREFMEAQT